ncbi:MAG: chemotaxis protein CheB [Phycisphaerae bacterium]|nr:chemotaxis protein CheB [Phycisphaerae bacterium]
MRGIVLIGASTGAPRTHHVYLKNMPVGFDVPVVVVQHMPPGPFIHGLLRYLQSAVKAPSKIAENGDPLRPGEVLVVEPGTQLRFGSARRCVRVSPDDGSCTFSPSMDVTFSSAAAVFGPACVAAMISGLHAVHDGLAGCRAVRRAGGKVLVTDPATTSCYLMVRQVRRAGEYDAEAPLDAIVPTAMRWLGRPSDVPVSG